MQMLHLQETPSPREVSKTLGYWFLTWLFIKIQSISSIQSCHWHGGKTYDVEFDETNGSQGAHENLDDVGDEPLREAMKNMPIAAIKPKEDKEDVQNIDMPSSSNVLHDDEKDERHANEDIFVSHE
jgi:hypothetical protein